MNKAAKELLPQEKELRAYLRRFPIQNKQLHFRQFRLVDALVKAAREAGFREGWELAHQPAKCGHARANYKDPKYGTPEYEGDEKCECCAALKEERERCAMPSKPDGWSVVLYDEHGMQVEEYGADNVGSWETIAAAIRRGR